MSAAALLLELRALGMAASSRPTTTSSRKPGVGS